MITELAYSICELGCVTEKLQDSRNILFLSQGDCHNIWYQLCRDVNKGLFVLLSRTQAWPVRTFKQEQEEISRNHVQTFIYLSLAIVCQWNRCHCKQGSLYVLSMYYPSFRFGFKSTLLFPFPFGVAITRLVLQCFFPLPSFLRMERKREGKACLLSNKSKFYPGIATSKAIHPTYLSCRASWAKIMGQRLREFRTSGLGQMTPHN